MSDTILSRHFRLNNGVSIPQVGLGVWQAGGGTKKAVVAALAAGYRHKRS